jgi:two-component system, NtrC family, sensor histidine kinase HydH
MTTSIRPIDVRARRLRWFGGAMAAAALLGVLQAGNLIYSQGLAREAAQAVLRHEAEGWTRALAGHVRERDDAPSGEALGQFLDDSAGAGLRYVGVVGPVGRSEAGEPAAPVIFDQLTHGRLTWVGSRVRLSMPARVARRGPPEGLPPDGRRMRVRPAYVIEFEPRAYARLVNDARRTLALGTITASTVVLLAGWAFGAMRRRHALEKEAERARHLAALGEMSAVLAHEIRNPLALVKGNAQLLVEELAGPGVERARGKAERVVQEATRIEHITTDLLDFVRQGQLDLAPTDLGALVRLAVADVVPADRLHLTLPEEPLTVAVDAARLRQVIENVARNAVQAGEGPVEVQLSAGPEGVELSIRDRGPGIPAGEGERIFEPFVTTRTRGTGLGWPSPGG